VQLVVLYEIESHPTLLPISQETSGTHAQAGSTCMFSSTLYVLTEFLAVNVTEKTDESCMAGNEIPTFSPEPASDVSPTPSPSMSRGLMADVSVPVAALSFVVSLIS